MLLLERCKVRKRRDRVDFASDLGLDTGWISVLTPDTFEALFQRDKIVITLTRSTPAEYLRHNINRHANLSAHWRTGLFAG